MSIRLGFQAELSYKVGGVSAGGSWNTIDNVRDLTLGLSKGEADATTRGNDGWEAVVGTIKRAEITLDMVWNTSDPAFQAMKDSFLDGSAIGIRAFDAPSGEGLEADMMVIDFTRNEQLTEAVTVSVTLKPTFSGVAPQWVTP